MLRRASSYLLISASNCKWFVEIPGMRPFFRPQLLSGSIGPLTLQSIRPLDPEPAARRLYIWLTASTLHTEDDPMFAARLRRTSFWSLSLAAACFAAQESRAWQQPMPSMPGMSTTDPAGHACDDMGASMKDMSVMGASMGGMTNHMCVTPLRPKQPGDEKRAQALVTQVRA